MRRSALYRRAERSTGPDLGEVVRNLIVSATTVASFVGLPGEPFVAPQPGWLLPVLLADGDLDWAVYDGQLGAGPRRMQEPTGPRLGPDAVAGCDLVLVPALLVDRDGYRLGRGGGSYDRALARTTGRTVALLDDDELVDLLPREPHDVPVSAAATPSGGVITLPRPRP